MIVSKAHHLGDALVKTPVGLDDNNNTQNSNHSDGKSNGEIIDNPTDPIGTISQTPGDAESK